MQTLLRIDASSRGADSVSRSVGNYFENVITKALPGIELIKRDLSTSLIPHISSSAIAGYYTPEEQMNSQLRDATRLSDELISELLKADAILLTVPMYNFSIPSVLKAWIDHIVRIGKTFAYDGTSFTGLVTYKSAHVICSYGAAGYGVGEPSHGGNFVEPYLRFLLEFLGFSDINFYVIEATTADDTVVERNIDAVKAEIDKVLIR